MTDQPLRRDDDAPCIVVAVSSRTCERGTAGCNVRHQANSPMNDLVACARMKDEGRSR